MTEEEIKKLVSSTVEETLTKMGVQVGDPIEMQKDIAFLRSLRSSYATAGRQGIIVATGIIVAAVFGLIWMAVKGQFVPPP